MKRHVDRSEITNYIKWGYFYKNINNFHSWSYIPEKQTENALEYNCKIILDYSYGLIHNGQSEDEITSKISNEIENHLNEFFCSIITKDANSNNVQKVRMFHFIDYSDFVESKNIKGFYPYLDSNFVELLINTLTNEKVFTVKSRNSTSDDIEYIKSLKRKKVSILLGSEYSIRNVDYRKTQEFREFADTCAKIYTTYLNRGLALQEGALKVCITNITTIHSQTFEEANPIYDKKKGLYVYESINNIPFEFEKDELKEYLHNDKKVIEVYADILYSCVKNAGYIVKREKK